MVEKEQNKIETLNVMWISLIGAFIIILCYAFDKIANGTSAFVFVVMTYFFMGFCIFILYNPFRRLINWKKRNK